MYLGPRRWVHGLEVELRTFQKVKIIQAEATDIGLLYILSK